MSESDRDAPKRELLPRPIDWEELYVGRFLKSADFRGKPYTLTIADVELEVLETEQGKKAKGVISFKETDKMWTINRTNGICVKAMFGRQVAGWVGKRVTLFPGEVESGSHKGEPAIRVYGSPDIDREFTVEIKLPRKRPITVTMRKTEVKTKGP